MTKFQFNQSDIGCYADGANGQQWRRNTLTDLISCLDGCTKELLAELASEPSDDYSEENDAIDILNDNTADGLYWTMLDGDLILTNEASND